METIVISATIRDVFGKKLANTRKNGQIPAVVYGNKKDNKSVLLDAKSFSKAFTEAGHSTIVELKLGEDASENVLIHDISLDPITSNITHVDFYRVNMNKLIRTEIPLRFMGESAAVFQLEGTLFKNTEEVEVETLPATLPPHINVDISVLDDFDKSIHVSDLKFEEGVQVLTESSQLICKVEPPRSEEEMAALDEEIGDAIPEGAEDAESADADSKDAEKGEESDAKPEGEAKDKTKE